MIDKKGPITKRSFRTKETVMLEITLLNRYREAVRGISPRFYRSTQHRDEVYMAIIEALEDLEDELEEIEENEMSFSSSRETVGITKKV